MKAESGRFQARQLRYGLTLATYWMSGAAGEKRLDANAII